MCLDHFYYCSISIENFQKFLFKIGSYYGNYSFSDFILDLLQAKVFNSPDENFEKKIKDFVIQNKLHSTIQNEVFGVFVSFEKN